MAAVLNQKAAAKAELRGKAAEQYAQEADALAGWENRRSSKNVRAGRGRDRGGREPDD